MVTMKRLAICFTSIQRGNLQQRKVMSKFIYLNHADLASFTFTAELSITCTQEQYRKECCTWCSRNQFYALFKQKALPFTSFHDVITIQSLQEVIINLKSINHVLVKGLHLKALLPCSSTSHIQIHGSLNVIWSDSILGHVGPFNCHYTTFTIFAM